MTTTFEHGPKPLKFRGTTWKKGSDNQWAEPEDTVVVVFSLWVDCHVEHCCCLGHLVHDPIRIGNGEDEEHIFGRNQRSCQHWSNRNGCDICESRFREVES